MSEEIKLKVAEVWQSDVDKSIVRIDREVMEQLGINSGDVIEIYGRRATPTVGYCLSLAQKMKV